jgi:membrane protein DedA with SNARE-associated domain
MEDAARAIADFVRGHESWAAPIVFALSFAESLAFISLFIPAWGALIAIGTLVATSGINPYPIWLAAAIGAALGDWLSYWFGHRYQHSLAQMWPLSRYPKMLPRGEAFVKRWGIAGIFVGRFWGPLRAVVPLVAGIFEMPRIPFQIANITSALLWAASLLFFGDVISQAGSKLWQATH